LFHFNTDFTMNQAATLARDATRHARSSKVVFRPLSRVMGAEVTGLDLSQPLSRDVFATLEELFAEYKLLCFRDQTLTCDQQVAFTERWGPPLEHTMAGHVQGGPRDFVQIASNAAPDGKPNGKHPDVTAMRWHTDRSWRSEPALATLLYGVEVPKVGGDTLFCNTTMAYEALPDETRRRVDTMKVIHSVEYSRRTADGPPATEYELRIGPPTPHPLARKHPLTGRRAIFLGCHAWKIDGMSEEEGRALIDELMAFATQDRFVYRHPWRQHDFVMWDNRCTFHAATPYDTFKELRTMHRTVVQGGPTS
jgi:alpha-ketoglutarate-dependent taurine dioxygenase